MANNNQLKLIAIVGPTAAGKTRLAVALAKQFNGELVSADSRQVYEQLNIGSGKEGESRQNTISTLADRYPSLHYIDDIPQWLIDIVPPTVNFTVAEYQERAYAVIADIHKRGKLPLLVGGTGLYVTAVLEGYQFKTGLARQSLNPRHAAGKADKQAPDWQTLTLGIDLPKAVLYQKIDQRLDHRLTLGLVTEGQRLIENGVSQARLREFGLEYRFLADYLIGAVSYETGVERLKQAIHQFARRQMTWFRHHGSVRWISSDQAAKQLVQDFLE